MDLKKITYSIKALILKEGRFLMVRRNPETPVFWELPGGHLEFGETAEEALVRELQEETGLVVEPVRVLDTWNIVLHENRQITGIIYLCRTDDSLIRLSDEHCEYRWVAHTEPDFNLLHDAYHSRMTIWDWNDFNVIKEA